MPFVASWMELEIIILSKSKREDKSHMISLTYGIKNMTKMNFYETETDSQT